MEFEGWLICFCQDEKAVICSSYIFCVALVLIIHTHTKRKMYICLVSLSTIEIIQADS